ncbi:methylenetetrahydrofolate reductase [Patulibacter defluvii]|uniref:methylenetetrahydrofolate reductase n=1 Tax=Patulibacter defluvii TaxID=3095358 RepID=UPI002A764985|nr:methylenetetrahydrofolate reductase [Patulibacter sp. DM4]
MLGNALPADDRVRYEVMPFPRAEREAAQTAGPLTLTVTCSPRHGIDATLDVAERLRALGHRVVPHLAARMVRDRRHLDAILARLADLDADEVFLVGGDAAAAAGPFASGERLLPLLREHPRGPRTIGVPAYPEGHPAIPEEVLRSSLAAKAPWADYAVTQICFDPGALLGWLARTRDAGIELPLYVGVPGAVDRRRLVGIALRVGVGASVRTLRRQQGMRRLMRRPASPAAPLLAAIDPLVGGDDGVRGYHVFTFNDLVGSVRELPAARAVAVAPPRRRDRPSLSTGG